MSESTYKTVLYVVQIRADWAILTVIRAVPEGTEMTGYREYRNRDDMREHGWKIDGSSKECNRCGSEINWATSPKGKKVPLDANSTVLHFKTCSGQSSAPGNVTNQPEAPNESAALRESLDECAQAVRELCRILRARTEAASK